MTTPTFATFATASRARIARPRISHAWSTDYRALPVFTSEEILAVHGTGQAMHGACLDYLRTKRGATPNQLRNARHRATILRLMAEYDQRQASVTPNVNLALPLGTRTLTTIGAKVAVSC